MPCCYHLDFCRLSRMRCLALALRDFAPQTSGGPLYESLLLYAVLSCRYRGTQIVFFRAVVDSTMRTSVSGAWSCACGMPLRSYEQRFPVCVTRRPRPSGSVLELMRRLSFKTCYLVDPASSHMLVSKIKPCMCKYELIQTVKLRMAH